MKKLRKRVVVLGIVFSLLITHVVPVRIFADELDVSEPAAVEAVEIPEEENGEALAEEAALETEFEEVKAPEMLAAPTEEKKALNEKSENPVKDKDPVIIDGPISVNKDKSVWAELTGSRKTFVYDGTEKSFGKITAADYTVTYFVNGEAVENLPEGFTVSMEAYRDFGGKVEKFDLENEELTGTDAGEYTVSVRPVIEGWAEGYFADKSKAGQVVLNIEPKEITVYIDGVDATAVYDGTVHGVKTELVSSDPEYDLKNVVSNAMSKLIGRTDVGEFSFDPTTTDYNKVYFNEDGNYSVDFQGRRVGTVTITPATLTITSESARVAYDSNDLDHFKCIGDSYTIEGLTKRDEAYFKEVRDFRVITGDDIRSGQRIFKNTFTYDLGHYAYNDVDGDYYKVEKNYIVNIVEGDLEFYDCTTEAYVEVMIKLSSGESRSSIYDGREHSIVVSADKFEFQSLTDKYDVSNVRLSVPEFTVTGTDAGSYAFLDESMFTNIDPRYSNVHFEIADMDRNMEILPLLTTVIVDVADEKVRYTGEEITVPSYRVGKIEYANGINPAVGYDAESSLTYTGENATVFGTAMGIYTAKLDRTAFTNTNKNYEVEVRFSSENDPCLMITQKEVVVTVTPNMFSVVYDGNEHTMVVDKDLSVTIDGVRQADPAFVFTSENYDTSNIRLRKQLVFKGTDAGWYTEDSWFYYLDANDQNTDVNYSLMDDIVLQILPKKTAMVISNAQMNYGDETPELTATFPEIPEGEKLPEYDLVIKGAETKPLDAGSYEIALEDKDSFLIMGRCNYEIDKEKITNGTLTVNARKVTVNVTGAQKAEMYNGSSHTLEGKWSTETADELYDLSKVTGPKPEDHTITETDAGVYPMGLTAEMFSNGDKNFEVTFEVKDGALTILEHAIGLGNLTLQSWEGQYDALTHEPSLTETSIEVGGKTYTLEPVFSYTLGGEEFSELPQNAGNYTAQLESVKVTDENGVDVSDACMYTVDAWETEVNILPREITVWITAEKRKANHGVKTRASYTISVDNNVEDPSNAFSKADISYDYINGEKDYVEAQYHTLNPVTQQLYIGRFHNVNPNYEAKFQFRGNTVATVLIVYYEVEKLEFEFTSETVTYDGQPHTFVSKVVGLSDDGHITVTGDKGHTYNIVVDMSKFGKSITKTNAGKYEIYPGDVVGEAISITDASGYECKGGGTVMNGSNSKKGVLTIERRKITAYVNEGIEKFYGDPDPDRSTWVTIEGLDGEPGLVGNDTVFDALMISREAGENVRRNQDGSLGGYLIKLQGIPQSSSEGGGGSQDERKRVAETLRNAPSAESIQRETEVARVQLDEREGEWEEMPYPGSGWVISRVSNYELTNKSEGYLYIKPVPLTITADYKWKWYRTDDPELTYVVEGLIGSEFLMDGFVTIWRDPGEEPGDYDIHLKVNPELYPPKPAEQQTAEPDPDPGVIVNPPIDEKKIAEEWAVEKEYRAETLKTERAAYMDSEKVRNLLTDVREEEIAHLEIEGEIEIGEDPWPGTIDPEPIDWTPVVEKPGSGEFHPINYEITCVENILRIITDTVTPPPVDPPVDPPVNPPVDPPIIPAIVRYTVTYLLAGGRTTSPQTVYPNLERGVNTPTIVEPTREGHEFKGWSPVVSDTVTGDAVYEAQWEPVAVIVDPETPMANGAAWALVNLLSAIATVITAIGMIITYFKKKKDDEEDEDEQDAQRTPEEDDDDEKKKKRRKSKFLGIIPAVGAVVTFILTEDMRLPMTMIDKWTFLMIAILFIGLALAFFTSNKKQEKEDEEEE